MSIPIAGRADPERWQRCGHQGGYNDSVSTRRTTVPDDDPEEPPIELRLWTERLSHDAWLWRVNELSGLGSHTAIAWDVEPDEERARRAVDHYVENNLTNDA
jgi:hypothetical protein